MLDYFDLVKLALPVDVRDRELIDLAPEKWWKDNSRLASAYALRKSPRINWKAYREQNPDVKDAGVDPCLHFLQDGIYEGRKLTSWHPLKQADRDDAPDISVVVASYDNAVYIGKCLESLVNQTHANIEIIVVDDASQDSTKSIISAYQQRDSRIKAFFNEKNEGTFRTRKRGVFEASGTYVLFIDGDDFLAHDACEKVIAEISKGYDMVEYCFNLVNIARANKAEVAAWEQFANHGAGKVYKGGEVVKEIFINRGIRWNLCGKAIVREICIAAYTDLPDGYYVRQEDQFTMVAIARLARNLSKIPARLYYYNYGVGLSTTADLKDKYQRWFNLGDTCRASGEYIKSHQLDIGYENIRQMACTSSISNWIAHVPDEKANEYLELIMSQFGFNAVIETMIKKFSGKADKIAARLKHCVKYGENYGQPEKIAIFYYSFSRGGVQTVLRKTADELRSAGSKVILLSEKEQEGETPLDLRIVRSGYGSYDNILEHIKSLEKVLRAERPSLMIYAAAFAPYILWDLILLHYYRIPVIISYHGSFALPYTNIAAPHSHHGMEAFFRCAHAVTCLSRLGELYFRIHGINAWHIPNPVAARDQLPAVRPDSDTIAVIGRLGDPYKRIDEALAIMKEVVKRKPWARMLLIGGFNDTKQRTKCEALIGSLGLQAHVVITGWVEDTASFLADCSVLLSTSYIESFPMGIAEAQTMGIPCVIYDLAVDMAVDNPGVVSVPQEDRAGAVAAIMELMDDPERWREASRAAIAKAAQYSCERFRSAMTNLLSNFSRLTPVSRYEESDYRRLIRYAGFYYGRRVSNA